MKILVKPAGADRRVPRPPLLKTPRYFAHDEATQVELDHYIQRRLDCGDLVHLGPAALTAAPVLAETPAEPSHDGESP